MVDVDRRLPPSLSAGLRRLSSRASSSATASTPRTTGLHSFAPFASSLVSIFKLAHIPLSPGLSEAELIAIESKINFTFPPDLRSLLAVAVPASPGFPDWRSDPPSLFHLPPLSLVHSSSSHLSRSLRSKMKRAPLLIPLFGRCYLPSRPSLAGNPVFYADDSRVFCCALDLKHFFSTTLLFSVPEKIPNPRWIEFWSEAAESCNRRRRSSSSGSSSRVSCSSSLSGCSGSSCGGAAADLGPDPESFVEIRPATKAGWVGKYMEEIGGWLRGGGWAEEEVEEMVHVSVAREREEEVTRDAMAMRAERWGEEMRRAGWGAEEVDDLFGLNKRRREVNLPPEIRRKVQMLAQEFFI